MVMRECSYAHDQRYVSCEDCNGMSLRCFILYPELFGLGRAEKITLKGAIPWMFDMWLGDDFVEADLSLVDFTEWVTF